MGGRADAAPESLLLLDVVGGRFCWGWDGGVGDYILRLTLRWRLVLEVGYRLGMLFLSSPGRFREFVAIASLCAFAGCSDGSERDEEQEAGSEPVLAAQDGGRPDAAVTGATDASSDGESLLDGESARGDAGVSNGGDGGSASGGDAGTLTKSCKRGVAYNNERAADAPAFGKSITWWYNWASSSNSAVLGAMAAQGVEFVPMIWSGPPTRTIDTQALIKSIPQGAKYLLGFNEPNFLKQAKLTPQQAADAWPQLEEIARARNLKLVSPAVNYCGPAGDCNQTDPFTWLNEFFAACKNCQVDYVAFHWYACSIDALKGKVNEFATKYKKPLWLTEFSCLDNPGDHSAAGQKEYMDKAVPFLESDARVFRYSWFIGRSSTAGAIDLFGASGALTPLGSAYAGYPGSCQ